MSEYVVNDQTNGGMLFYMEKEEGGEGGEGEAVIPTCV